MDTQFEMELEAPLGETAFKTDHPPPINVQTFDPSTDSSSLSRRSDMELNSYVPSSSLLPSASLLSASLYTAPALGPTMETGGRPPPGPARNDTYQQLKLKYMRSLNIQVPPGRSRGGPSPNMQLSQSMPIPARAPVPIPKKMEKTRESENNSEDDTKFVPPHELVNHGDTFSVWHYEQRKRVAAKEAV